MSTDVGLLVIRVLFGLPMAAHGSQKLFGWFGGYGLKGTGGFFEGLGFRPGHMFVAAASLCELAGGLLLALGLITPIGGALVLVSMLVAIAAVHWPKGFFATNSGIEVPFLYAVVAVGLAISGPGSLSLDWAFGMSWVGQRDVVVGVLVLAVVAAIASLALRRPAKPAESERRAP